MPILETRGDRSSEGFRTNREQMLALIAEFRGLEQNVRDASNAKRDLFRKRGQLLPRERVALLLDRGAPWLELATLAGYRMHDDDGRGGIQAGGGIAGVGYVSGIRCVVAASDSAIKGGTSTPMGVKKNLRVQQIALENKLPMLRLVESGGANLLYQGEMFVEGGRGCAPQPARSPATRSSAARKCTRPYPASANIWPRTMATVSASPATSWRSCPGISSCRSERRKRSSSRATRPTSSRAWCRSTTASPTTCGR